MSRYRLNKISAPSASPPNKAEIYFDTTGIGNAPTPCIAAIDENGNKMVVAPFTTGSFRLIKVQLLTSASGTYTPTAGTRRIFVEGVGGGGQGGGATASSSGQASIGGGGGAGSYASKWYTADIASSYAYTCGAGGTTGTTGTGQSGADSTFNTSDIVAKGGTGGATMAAGTSVIGQTGGVSGLASGSTGDLCGDGEPGGTALRLSIAANGIISGQGGDAFFGGGAASVVGVSNTGTSGNNAGSYGSGGSGAASWATGTLRTGNGGNGGNGCWRVWEFG